jgi:hypothetical protein
LLSCLGAATTDDDDAAPNTEDTAATQGAAAAPKTTHWGGASFTLRAGFPVTVTPASEDSAPDAVVDSNATPEEVRIRVCVCVRCLVVELKRRRGIPYLLQWW